MGFKRILDFFEPFFYLERFYSFFEKSPLVQCRFYVIVQINCIVNGDMVFKLTFSILYGRFELIRGYELFFGFHSKVSTTTPIEVKQETFQSRSKGGYFGNHTVFPIRHMEG